MLKESFFSALQKACLPGVWSRAVALSRENAVKVDTASTDEILCRVIVGNRPVSPKVTLWPEDEDWHCDCGDRNDPCMHIAAAAIAIKSGLVGLEAKAEEKPVQGTLLQYRFTTQHGILHFDRWIAHPKGEQRLSESLVSFVGGIQSGRISLPPLAATKQDFTVDIALQNRRGPLDSETLAGVLKALQGMASATLDGKPIQTSGQALPARIEITESGDPRQGFIWKAQLTRELPEGATLLRDAQGREVAALAGNVLRPLAQDPFSVEERKALSAGLVVRDATKLVGEWIPAWEEKLEVRLLAPHLPRPIREEPRALIRLTRGENDSMRVLAVIGYGTPSLVAEVQGEQLFLIEPSRVPIRDRAAEKALARQLQSELQIQAGQSVAFDGLRAVEFNRKLKGWDVEGADRPRFEVSGRLEPRLAFENGKLALTFQSGRSTADTARVLREWREQGSLVPLLDGGWAELPSDWLGRYGKRIIAMLEAQAARGTLPPHLIPEAASALESLNEPLPDALAGIRDALNEFDRIRQAELPKDLKAELRSYQRKGVDWLAFLRDHQMGALLADDMGLGKTLQSLCAIRGRTLIACPTSVMQGWLDQVAAFRPALKVCHYYGPQRALGPDFDIVLTSYAVLRLDRDTLAAREWDTVILDEANAIKNPESQVAQAAFSLRSRFKIALSGTPVENRLEELWSVFRFLNPGLLEGREEFKESFSEPISRGDRESAERLRARIKPFVLRRLKSEVAPELPPKTETLLHCELSTEERQVYESILASSREEVLKALESGGSVFTLLEALLRLRQACCHPALVPGQVAPSSSKTDLLVETISTSLEEGHRSLVFSQWTSYLDLIEPHLKAAGIDFLRLDGSTPDRAKIVHAFQSRQGAPVLLMSLKAGGVGLNLTAADHVFILDPWWNPAAEEQAADRAHRIGQENPVLVHRLVAKDTIEDRVLMLQRAKRELAQTVLEGTDGAAALTRDDLAALLQ